MSAPRLSVLIAEDEPLASMALRAQLEALGYDVVGPARDGDEAVALGVCFPVDIAIFDFGLPARNGLDAAIELFRRAPTPVVLLSGFDASYLPAPIPRPPVFASITKPVNLADIRAGLDQARQNFQQWVDAEPDRAGRVDAGIRERAAIERKLRDGALDRSVLREAVRLFRLAGQEERSLLELVDEFSRDGEP